jgi:lysozyme family protein
MKRDIGTITPEIANLAKTVGTSKYGPLFGRCVKKLVLNEGRYANAPGDRGRRTWYGVSERFQPDYFRRINTASTEVERLEIAAECYHDLYWSEMHCGEFEDSLAFRLLDTSVLCGPAAATMILQRACNVCPTGIIIAVDGRLGPKTLQRATSLSSSYGRNLCGWTTYYFGERFMELRNKHPGEYDEFLWGWGARIVEPSEKENES